MLMNDEQFEETHRKLGMQGGFTVNPRTGADITSGISVAPRSNERKVPINESQPLALKQFAVDNAQRFHNEYNDAGNVVARHNAVIGGWRSEDTDYFDTPTIYKNTPGGEKNARKNMVLSGQEAGFHLDTFQEIFNPFNPEARRKQGMEPHELADAASRGKEGAEFAMRQPEVSAWVHAPVEAAAVRKAQASRSGALQGKGRPR